MKYNDNEWPFTHADICAKRAWRAEMNSTDHGQTEWERERSIGDSNRWLTVEKTVLKKVGSSVTITDSCGFPDGVWGGRWRAIWLCVSHFVRSQKSEQCMLSVRNCSLKYITPSPLQNRPETEWPTIITKGQNECLRLCYKIKKESTEKKYEPSAAQTESHWVNKSMVKFMYKLHMWMLSDTDCKIWLSQMGIVNFFRAESSVTSGDWSFSS